MVSKKSLSVSTSEGDDLHTVFCYLQDRYGNIKHKVIEAILDRYLVSALEDKDPRLAFEVNDRSNNLEAAVKTMRSRIGSNSNGEIAAVIEADYQENANAADLKPFVEPTQQQAKSDLQAQPVSTATKSSPRKQLLDMGVRYE